MNDNTIAHNVIPQLDSLEIRHHLEKDFQQLHELSENVFGSGYLDSWFNRKSNQDDFACFVAIKNAKLVGIICLNRQVSMPPDHRFLQCLVVDEKYRRQGIATSLYRSASQALAKEEIKYLYTSCWKESLQPGIIPFLKKEGWEVSSTKERYWYVDSIEMGYQCIRCGNPCSCTAVLMEIALLEQCMQ